MRTGGGCRTADREISRFPRKERLHMPGSLTTPGRPGARGDAPGCVAFRHLHGVGTQNRNFRGSMAGLCAPLSTLRRDPRGHLRMTRGRCGSLLLHRKGLAPSTPCRSPGASQMLSGLPLIADIAQRGWHGRKVPKPDLRTAANSVAIQSVRRRGRRAAWEVSAHRRAKSWHCGGTRPRLRQRRV